MATIIVHPEHVEGLHYVLNAEFESACEEQDVDRLRDLIAFVARPLKSVRPV